jgi:hypothetical protein
MQHLISIDIEKFGVWRRLLEGSLTSHSPLFHFIAVSELEHFIYVCK